MSKLTNKEIDFIVDTYKETKSIAKTIEITGFAKSTINNYVREISKNDSRSRDFINKVLKINPETEEILGEYNKPSTAAKENSISPASICRCLKGDLNTAGGFKWKYKKD